MSRTPFCHSREGGNPGKIKNFFSQNEREIALSIGVFLISIISFQIGFLWKVSDNQAPVVITDFEPAQANLEGVLANPIEDKDNLVAPVEKLFVASVNSKKFHKITCSWADRINEENKIFFSSREEAEKMGYELASCCQDK